MSLKRSTRETCLTLSLLSRAVEQDEETKDYRSPANVSINMYPFYNFSHFAEENKDSFIQNLLESKTHYHGSFDITSQRAPRLGSLYQAPMYQGILRVSFKWLSSKSHFV